MSTDEPRSGVAPKAERRRERERERRRLAEIFGDVLPESTQDDQEEAGGDAAGRASHDADLIRDVPPHHG